MTTVMLIEDNQTLIESISFELEMRGYDVLQATNGSNAIDLLEATPSVPDIIVSDIAMPDMDGYQLLETVRAHDEWDGLPFIFLTAFDSSSAVRLGKQLGVDDYLTKPFEPEDLVTAIESKLKRFRSLDERAERKLDASRDHLLRILSHELRTPLTTMYGSTKILEMTLADMSDENTQAAIQILDSGAQRMNRLISRILMFSQLEGGNAQRTFEQYAQPIAVDTCIEKAVSDYKENRPNLTHVIETDIEPDLPLVNGMKDFVCALVDELLDNAIKFSLGCPSVHIGAVRNNDSVQVTVRDAGSGIAPQHLEKIWENFTQIDRDINEQQGMGLGLAIVKKITELHGGTCEVTSTPDDGTTATFLLPIAH